MSECIYTARQAPNLRVSLRIDGAKRYIEFKECRFVTEDEAVIAELDRMLASPKYGSLRQLVRKVDKEAAEALVREHRRQKGRLNAAVKGATTTAPLDEARKLIPPREHVNKLPIDVNEMTQPEAEMLQQQLAGDDIRLMEETDLAKLRAETQVARAAQVPVSDVDVGEPECRNLLILASHD